MNLLATAGYTLLAQEFGTSANDIASAFGASILGVSCFVYVITFVRLDLILTQRGNVQVVFELLRSEVRLEDCISGLSCFGSYALSFT